MLASRPRLASWAVDISSAYRSLAVAEESSTAPSGQHCRICQDDETPADLVPCQCTRTHGSGPCEGGTDHPSKLCQWCREDGTPDGRQCNCLCAGCDAFHMPTRSLLRPRAPSRAEHESASLIGLRWLQHKTRPWRRQQQERKRTQPFAAAAWARLQRDSESMAQAFQAWAKPPSAKVWSPSDEPHDVTLMHVFSNVDRPGGMSDATRSGGGAAINIDIKIGGEEHNICRDEPFAAMCKWIIAGHVQYLWLGIVCSSFSLLWIQAGRPVLRSRRQPEGVDGLSPRWRRYVDRGNMIVERATVLAQLQFEAGNTFYIENVVDYGYMASPHFRWSKRAHVPIWITKWVRELAANVPLFWGTTMMCGWGSPFHKPTTVAAAGPGAHIVVDINNVTCTTLRHELVADGVDSKGRQLSQISGEYPPLFCAFFGCFFTQGFTPMAASAATQSPAARRLLEVISVQRSQPEQQQSAAEPLPDEPTEAVGEPEPITADRLEPLIAAGWSSAHAAIPKHWPEYTDVTGELYERVREQPLPFISRRRAEPESRETLARRPMPRPTVAPQTEPSSPYKAVPWPEGCPPRPIAISQLYNPGVYDEILGVIDDIKAALAAKAAGGEARKVESRTFTPEQQPSWAQACQWDATDPTDVVPLQPSSQPPMQGARPQFFKEWAAKMSWPDMDMITQVAETGVESRTACTKATVVMGHHGGLRQHFSEAQESIDDDTARGFMTTGRRDLWIVPSIMVAKNCVRRRQWKLKGDQLTRSIKWRVSTDDSIEINGETSRNMGMSREAWESPGLPSARTLGELVAIVKSVCSDMGMEATHIEAERIALWAFDLSHAYRELGVQRAEQGQQSFVWIDGVRLDLRCVFGAAHMVDFFQRVTSFVMAVARVRIKEYESQHPPSAARQAWLAWRKQHVEADAACGQSVIYIDDGLGLSVLPQGAPVMGHPAFADTPSTSLLGIEPNGGVKLSIFVNKSTAQVDLAIMKATFQEAGWGIADDKVQLGLSIQELGIWCTSEGDGALSVPEAKRRGMLVEIAEQQQPQGKDKAVALEDIEGLTGRCLHIATVTPEANPYLQPMYRMQRARTHLVPLRRGGFTRVKPSRIIVHGEKPSQRAYQSSLRWWQHALEAGISTPLAPKLSFPALGEPGTAFMFTDAARELGTGHGAFTFVHAADGSLRFLYIDPRWPDQILSDLRSNRCSMPAGEGIGAVVFADLLGRELPGLSHLVIFSDSTAVVAAINSGSSSSPQLNFIVRWMFDRNPHVQFMAVHQPGVRNTAADDLSRFASAQVISDARAAGARVHELTVPSHALVMMTIVSETDQRAPPPTVRSRRRAGRSRQARRRVARKTAHSVRAALVGTIEHGSAIVR